MRSVAALVLLAVAGCSGVDADPPANAERVTETPAPPATDVRPTPTEPPADDDGNATTTEPTPTAPPATEPPAGEEGRTTTTEPTPTEPIAGDDGGPTTTEPTLTVPIEAEGGLAAQVRDGWEVVFADTFDGDTLDPVWNTCHWWQIDGGCTIASNDEQQWYRPEGVSLGEGDLRLRATDDPQRTSDGNVLPFRSGMVTTGPAGREGESSFAFTYGEVTARAMVPAGSGTWPAIWLLSADRTSLPEIDIFEWYGNRPDLVTSHVHQRVDGERVRQRIEHEVDEFAGVWHTFTVTWLPDRVVFAVDGVETGRVTDPAVVPQTPMYLVMNLAMGGFAGPVETTTFPQTFRIDEIVITQPIEP